MNIKRLVGSILLLLLSQNIYAGTYTIPKTYVSGDTLGATDLNAENTALKTAVDDNDSKSSTNSDNITINANNITDNANGITGNASSIAALPSMSIAFNQGTIWRTVPVTTAANIMAVSFTAPAAGRVIVEASGTISYADTSGASNGYYCLDLSNISGYIGGCTPMGGSFSAKRSFIPSGLPDSSGMGFGYSIREVVSVTSGTTYTWYLNGVVTGTGSTASLFHPVLTALFIPGTM